MSDALSAIRTVLGVTVAAFLIWLTVKLVNRRKGIDRKYCILAGVLYCLSVGPIGRIAQEADAEWIMYAYFPIILVAREFRPLGDVLLFYLSLCGVKIG